MTETEAGADQPPRTGDHEIDEALGGVQQLEELPVADHHDVLAPAHDQLQQALNRDHSDRDHSQPADSPAADGG